MLSIKSIQQFDSQAHRGALVTMGVFDGVHLGHQALVTEVVLESRKRSHPAVVLT